MRFNKVINYVIIKKFRSEIKRVEERSEERLF